MKKIKALFITLFTVTLMSVTAYGKINVTSNDISGDDNLKATAQALREQGDTISENAVFVAVDGVNSSDGGTIDKPYATIDYAIQKIPSTETVIYVRGGTYDQKIAVRKSGTAENYLTIKAYPGEKPILETTSTGRIIDPNKNNYIIFEGLTLKAEGDSVSSSTHGVEMVQGHHIIFKNLEITNINVPDPTSSSVATHAFNLYGNNASVPISNILIEDCYIHDMETGWSEAIAVNGNSEYVSVINCTIADIGNIGLDFAGNFGACEAAEYDQARYCVARGNTVSNCISPNARSYGLYNDGGRDNVFDRNIVFGCSGGIEIGSEEGGAEGKQDVKNITVTNNLVYNNIEVGIAVGGYSITNESVGYVYNTKVYNNTVINSGETDIIINKGDNLDFRNNIIYSKTPTGEDYKYAVKESFGSDHITNLTFKNNLYYSPEGENAFCFLVNDNEVFGLSNWIDTTGVFSDPLFSDNYLLGENSPAIGLADSSVASYLGNYDLSNSARIRNSLDAGCYEYQEGETVTIETTTVTESTSESTTQAPTESTTEGVTESTTEATTTPTEASEWIFTDGSWADKSTAKTVYTVNGLTVRHNASYSDTMGFKFDKNTKTDKTEGYYIRLNAEKGDTITVYVSLNTSKTGSYAYLAMDKINSDGGQTNISTAGTEANKSEQKPISFSVAEDGEYIIYTSSESSGSAYYSRVSLESPLSYDFNNDGTVDTKDAVAILKHCSNINIVTDEELLQRGDVNSDGVTDLTDAIALLSYI